MSAWRQERSRLRSIVRAIDRDDLSTAATLLVQAELEAFERSDTMAGEYAFARYQLSGRDRRAAADVIRRILDLRYGGGV